LLITTIRTAQQGAASAAPLLFYRTPMATLAQQPRDKRMTFIARNRKVTSLSTSKGNQAMPWKLIFQLSLFGLAMGLATVFWIPSNVEPFLWIVIFGFCAFAIGRSGAPRPFVIGVLLGLANSVWITASHILLFDRYLANHPREAEMMQRMPLPGRLMMTVTGPMVGLISGIVIGVLALIAAKIFRRRTAFVSS
jgi:hypothetical protein